MTVPAPPPDSDAAVLHRIDAAVGELTGLAGQPVAVAADRLEHVAQTLQSVLAELDQA